MICVCIHCGKSFIPKTKNRPARFCSYTCNSIVNGYKKGHKFHAGGEKGWIKKGQRLSPDTEFKRRSGKWVTRYGYIMVYSPDHPNKSAADGVMEHRLVMEKHLHRYLQKHEIVHHKNGDKSDNRLENLELHDRMSHAQLHHNGKRYESFYSK